MEEYRPYAKAIENILNGEYIDNLDEIKRECDRNYLMSFKTPVFSGDEKQSRVVFHAKSRNRINNGVNTLIVYSEKSSAEDRTITSLLDESEDLLRDFIEKNR